MANDHRERSFFGKVIELIHREAANAKPRQAPDVIRDLVAVLAKLIEQAPKDHRDALRSIVYEQLIRHLERIGKDQPLELPSEYEGSLH